MNDFAERLATGHAHERRVASELESRGWTVTPWGQATWPEATRQAIREAHCRIRYFPDLVASRGSEVVAVDAKDRMRSTNTDRYAVHRECVSFGVHFHAAFGLPVFYVFGNLGVLLPGEIISYGSIGPLARSGAYYLVNGRMAHHFDDVFGAGDSAAAA